MNGKISISRVSGTGHDGYVHITIKDATSGIQFFDGKMSFEEFGELISGSSHRDITFTTRGLQNINKVKEQKDFSFTVKQPPLLSWEDRQQFLVEECLKVCPEGWHISTYLGSKGNVTEYSDECGFRHMYKVNTHIYRYVDAPDKV